MAGIRPWNPEGHAVAHVTFGITFPSRPPARSLREALALHSKLKADYPRKRELQGRAILIDTQNIAADEPRPDVGAPELAGFIFDNLMPDGVVLRSIELNNNVLTVTRRDYEGWDKTWGEVREVITMMLPLLMELLDIQSVHLQFLDRFVWEGDPGDFKADLLLRQDSPFVTPNVFEARELWHSTHGYFEYPEKPDLHQLLSAVEVRAILPASAGLEPGSGLVVDVKHSLRSFPGVTRAGGEGKTITTFEKAVGADGGKGVLDAYIEEMHDKAKWLLRRIINDDMCDRIPQLGRPD